MTKLEFLESFKSACDTLPAELVDAAVADFERQFTDQFLAGQSEQMIVGRWGSPQHAALKLKLGTLNGSLKQVVSAEKVARVGISSFGLMILDLFLFIPGMAYFAVLMAFYFLGCLIYLAGIFQTSAGLAGVNFIDVPANYFSNDMVMKGSTHLNIADIDIVPSQVFEGEEQKISNGNPEQTVGHDMHYMHDRGFHIATHLGKNSVWKGVGTTLSGMLMLVLCLLATRFSIQMLKQFASWHFTVLKSA